MQIQIISFHYVFNGKFLFLAFICRVPNNPNHQYSTISDLSSFYLFDSLETSPGQFYAIYVTVKNSPSLIVILLGLLTQNKPK